MVSVEELRIEFGSRVLWKDVSFVLQPGDRVALVGPNGAGKSTLLKILAGINGADGGRVVKARSLRSGYLAQEGVEVKGRSLWTEVESAFGEARELEARYDRIGEQLERTRPEDPAYHQLLEEMGAIQLRIETAGLEQIRPRMETVLRGLGFAAADFERDCGEFSGGWQMRIALAKLLLAEPELLLLDEPTNHLDFDSQRWLEKHLREWRGALVLISHDRAFLDGLVQRTIAVGHGRADIYSGNYSFYEREAKARREQLVQAKAAQDREIAKTQQFIDRFRASANKASQVQSRIKQLAKVERIEIEQELDEIGFRFPEPPHSGQVTLTVEDARQQYGDLVVFDQVTLRVEKGAKVAIVGVNGAGKSTFSRMIAGREQPRAGSVKYAHGVEIAYYSQDSAEELDPSLDVVTTIERAMPHNAGLNPRTVLGAFLFRGDDVFKSVTVLSGGERSRLALAKMLLKPANLLILDEPTNHLDLASQEMLAKALAEYRGTVLIVSHNRGFLDPVVDQVFEFRRGRAPLVFPGTLSAFLEKKEADERAASGGAVSKPALSSNGGGPGAAVAVAAEDNRARGREARQLRARVREARRVRIAPLEKRVAEVEAAIAAAEAEKAALSEQLADPNFHQEPERVALVVRQFAEIEARLNRNYSAWDGASEELEREEAILRAEGLVEE